MPVARTGLGRVGWMECGVRMVLIWVPLKLEALRDI